MKKELIQMEMPCRCDCGEWFDLNEGYRSVQKEGVIVCEVCHDLEENAYKIMEEIRYILESMSEGIMTKQEGKKQLREILKSNPHYRDMIPK